MDERPVVVARDAARAGAEVAQRLFRTDLDVRTKSGKTDVVTRADRQAQERVVERIHAADPGAVVVGEEGAAPAVLPAEGRAWLVDPIDGTHNYVTGNRRWVTSVAAVVDGRPVAAANVLPALGDTYLASTAGVPPRQGSDTEPPAVRRNSEAVGVSERADPERCTVVPTVWWDHDSRATYAAATRAIVERFGDLARLRSAQAALSLLSAGGLDGVFTTVDAHPWDTVAGAHMVRQAGGTVTDLDGGPWRPSSRGLVASNGHVHGQVLAAAREARDATDTAGSNGSA